MIHISLYQSNLSQEWDAFCLKSKNATFLHHRGYMDYHSDRFSDFSLIARHETGEIAAILPACRHDDTVVSHSGLTYGGWLMPLKHFDANDMLQVMDAAMPFLGENCIKSLVYKPVPHIYHTYPAEEDIYALFRHGARLEGCNISSVIPLDAPLAFDRGNKSSTNAATRAGVKVNFCDCFDDIDKYWSILTERLTERYDARPVHSLDEICLLQSRFPKNIRLITAKICDEIVAGVVLFVTQAVAHCQYIASSATGRETKALPLLMAEAISWAKELGLRYFDFGTSNENGGQILNHTLLEQKARLGGRGVAYPIYKVAIR